MQTTDATIPNSLAVVDRGGRIVSVNSTWLRIGGDNQARMQSIEPGANYLDICDAVVGEDQADASAVAAAIRKVCSGQSEFERHTYKCGIPSIGANWFEVQIQALDSAPSGLISVSHHNITEQRRLSLSSDEIRTRLSILIDGVSDFAIYMLDPAGHLLSWNSGAERLTGWSKDEIIGKHLEILFNIHDRAAGIPAQHLAAALSQGTFRTEGWRVRKDGSGFFGFSSITTVRDDHGAHIGFAKISGDVTALRLAKSQLASAAADLQIRNTELEQFVHTVSHDLKSPLVTIAGYTSHIRNDIRLARYDRIEHFTEQVIAASGRMHTTIDDLLHLSSVGRSHTLVLPIDTNSLVAKIKYELCDTLEKSGISIQICGDLPIIYADPTRLREVFENLFGNAIKYGCPIPGMTIDIRGDSTLSESRIQISDHGPGIPIDARTRIFGLFQRFTTRNAITGNQIQGTGVGLAIVKRIMDVHKGSIRVEDTPTGGATFMLSFPKPLDKLCLNNVLSSTLPLSIEPLRSTL